MSVTAGSHYHVASTRKTKSTGGGILAIISFILVLVYFLLVLIPVFPYLGDSSADYLLGMVIGVLLRWLPLLLIGIAALKGSLSMLQGSAIFHLAVLFIALIFMLMRSDMSYGGSMLIVLSIALSIAAAATLVGLVRRSKASSSGAALRAFPGILMLVAAVLHVAYIMISYGLSFEILSSIIFSEGFLPVLCLMVANFCAGFAYLAIGLGVFKPAPAQASYPNAYDAWQAAPGQQGMGRPSYQLQQGAGRAAYESQSPASTQPTATAASQPAAATRSTPRFCSGCGRPLDPGEKFCRKCGTKIQ